MNFLFTLPNLLVILAIVLVCVGFISQHFALKDATEEEREDFFRAMEENRVKNNQALM